MKKKSFFGELLTCPKCRADFVIINTINYPNSFECKKCGNLFLKISKALVDD